MRRDQHNNLICYNVSENISKDAPQSIRKILTTHKYLGVPRNAQLDGHDGKQKIIKKLSQRIGLIATKAHSITEAKISHNMIVCQVATFSPLCIPMSLQECMNIDKQLLKAYQYRLKHTPSDAKHNIFITEKRGGLGLRSFTREYLGALIRDIEVYINNPGTAPSHALCSSIEEATKQHLWCLYQENKLPNIPILLNQIQQFQISPRKVLTYETTFDSPTEEEINYLHTHTMDRAIKTTSLLGFMLRDLNSEFCSRFVDELVIGDSTTRAIGNPHIKNRAKLGACIGPGNGNFIKYSLTGRISILIRILIEEAKKNIFQRDVSTRNKIIEDRISRPAFYNEINAFPGEISAIRLATKAKLALGKFKEDYINFGFFNLIEWRVKKLDIDKRE
jgi:hypothetical protein